MNFPQNSSDVDYKLNNQIPLSNNSLNQEIFKAIPSNQLTINFSKDESHSNSSEIKNNEVKDINQKAYLPHCQNEEIEEEEEINSDEYVSSTMLDVDTNTYINMSSNAEKLEEKNVNKINDKKNALCQGKLRTKEKENILPDFILNDIQTVEGENEINLNKEINNINNDINNKINNNNNINNKININTDNGNDIDLKKGNHHNKSEYLIVNRPSSMNKDKKNISNSKDKTGIFTPTNDSKKKFKILRDMIFKKFDNYQNKNLYNLLQSNTINVIENSEDKKNDMISYNNDIIKENNEIEKNKRNKNSKVIHNNSISIVSNKSKNNSNKNVSIKKVSGPQQNIQKIQNNNNKNNKINIYKKDLIKDIKDIGSINIDDQKYQLIPQSIKKIKTQGRIGRIVYSDQNKRNNFIYISNNTNNNINNNITNKSINSPMNKKINRISPSNCISNVEYFNSIITNKNKKIDEHNYLKHTNIHSLKNLKSESLQKNIKKYILDDEYLTIFPLTNEKNTDNQKIKILKDSKNKKIIRNQNPINKNNEEFKIKKIIPINMNANKKELRSGDSCNSKKVLNNNQSEQILKTISNHNKKIDIYNNFKNNNKEMTQIKPNNGYNKKFNGEKIEKNRELSFNIALDNNSIKNILSLKKIKNLKSKFVLQNNELNVENGGRNTSNFNNKKIKPLTTRIKLDLLTEENKNNIRKNHTKFIYNNNENKKNNSNSLTKKVIYIENNTNTYKHINSKSLMYNSLSPNCQSIKQLVDKGKISNIKELYNNMNNHNINNQGRNTYNIYVSSKMNNNSNNLSNNNMNSNSNSKIFYKKIQKESVKNKRSNGGKSINYNNESNIPENIKSNSSVNNKKIIVFNNVSNYNINNTNNTLNNITNIREGPNSNIYKKTLEILSPFPSIINNNKNNNKKFYVSKPININNNNHIFISNKNSSRDKKNNLDLLGQNFIYSDNCKNKSNHVFNGLTNPNYSNKGLYNNKNIMYKVNRNGNISNNYNSTLFSEIIKINNNINNNNYLYYSSSNDRERNTITNKSYGNININKKGKNRREKNYTLEAFEKINKNGTKKSLSPFQELKTKF